MPALGVDVRLGLVNLRGDVIDLADGVRELCGEIRYLLADLVELGLRGIGVRLCGVNVRLRGGEGGDGAGECEHTRADEQPEGILARDGTRGSECVGRTPTAGAAGLHGASRYGCRLRSHAPFYVLPRDGRKHMGRRPA